MTDAIQPPLILLAHPGTQTSYQLAAQLVRHEKLSEFWTGLALAKDAWYTQTVQTFVPEAWRRKFAGRVINNVPRRFLRTRPLNALKSIHQIRRGKSPQKVFHETNGEFQEKIPVSSFKTAAGFIGFDTASWIIAKHAEEMGKPFFLDRSHPHPVTNDYMLRNVVRRFPQWESDFEPRIQRVLQAENQEHRLSTRIIVASSYSKHSLTSRGITADKIVVNPYGVDLKRYHPPRAKRSDQTLRFVFLGSVSARKGVPLLLEAWRSLALKDCELWIIGSITSQARSLIPSLPGLKILGRCPHEELPRLLRQCDVLIFPSYCEGFGQVLLEALASGLPVLTTEATAGPDLIQSGTEGLIVQSGDLEELCRGIKYFAENPAKLKVMSEAARRCAEKFTWDDYGDRWNRLLEEFI